MKISEKLQELHDTLMGHWTKHWYKNPQTGCMCLSGGINKVSTGDANGAIRVPDASRGESIRLNHQMREYIQKALRQAGQYEIIVAFNDSITTTEQDVLDVIVEAKKFAEYHEEMAAVNNALNAEAFREIQTKL